MGAAARGACLPPLLLALALDQLAPFMRALAPHHTCLPSPHPSFSGPQLGDGGAEVPESVLNATLAAFDEQRVPGLVPNSPADALPLDQQWVPCSSAERDLVAMGCRKVRGRGAGACVCRADGAWRCCPHQLACPWRYGARHILLSAFHNRRRARARSTS